MIRSHHSSIWIERRTDLPNSIRLRGDRDASRWTALNGARPAFEKDLQEAAWTLFFMADEVALQRLIAKVKSSNCNGIEISQVTTKSFLKVPYVTACAHARHLQSGSTFAGQTFKDAI